MRNPLPRRLTLAAATLAVAVASVTLTTGVAQAKPSTPAANAGLPPALVRAIQHDLHLTPQQYLDRAAVAQRLGAYATDLHKRQPSVYAGSWLDQHGTPIVAVTTTEAAQQVSAAGYHPRLAQVSADTLDDSLRKVNDWVAALPGNLAKQIKSAAVDTLNNQIVLTVLNSDIGKALNLPSLAARLKVELAPDGPAPTPSGPAGGDAYITTAGPLTKSTPTDKIIVCSFGFTAVDRAGNPLALSAGHCDPSPSTTGTSHAAPVYLPNTANVYSSKQVGSFAQSGVGPAGGGLDYSIIALDRKAASSPLGQPTVRGANGTALTITGVGTPVVGAPVCKSGQSSTFTCGTILASDVDTKLFASDGSSRVVHGFADSACTLGGDSGGAIVTGTRALGITSGSNSEGQPDCNTANLTMALDGGTVNFGIPVADILQHVNATTAPGAIGAGIRLRTGK